MKNPRHLRHPRSISFSAFHKIRVLCVQIVRRVFFLAAIFGLHPAFFPVVLRYAGACAHLGVFGGELCILWLVGLAFFIIDHIFHGHGLVVWPLAQLSGSAGRNPP
jgi:hypothetical protein